MAATSGKGQKAATHVPGVSDTRWGRAAAPAPHGASGRHTVPQGTPRHLTAPHSTSGHPTAPLGRRGPARRSARGRRGAPQHRAGPGLSRPSPLRGPRRECGLRASAFVRRFLWERKGKKAAVWLFCFVFFFPKCRMFPACAVEPGV